MKKIIVIDGGPRRAMNTARMLQRFELTAFSETAKQNWRDDHWEKDLQKAFDAGRKMAGAE